MRTRTGSVLLSALFVAVLSTAAPSDLLAQKTPPPRPPQPPKKQRTWVVQQQSHGRWGHGTIAPHSMPHFGHLMPGHMSFPSSFPGPTMSHGRFGDVGRPWDFSRDGGAREFILPGQSPYEQFIESMMAHDDPFRLIRGPGGRDEVLMELLGGRPRRWSHADAIINQIYRSEPGFMGGLGLGQDMWMPQRSMLYGLPPDIAHLLGGGVPSRSMFPHSIGGGGAPWGHHLGGLEPHFPIGPRGRGGLILGPSFDLMNLGGHGIPNIPGLYPQRARYPGSPYMPMIGPGSRFNPGVSPYYPRTSRVDPPPPSKEEQRSALKKLRQGLEAVDDLTKQELWGLLDVSLEKQGKLSSLPPQLAGSLRGLQGEAALLARWTDLRQSVTTSWSTAPDADALEQHLAAVRSATGDRELTDHLKRLLAVKAAWEGHDQTARALGWSGETLDVDAELLSLHRSLAEAERPGKGGNIAPTQPLAIATDAERDEACGQVAKSVLLKIDQHIEAGRHSAAVHTRSVTSYKDAVGKAMKKLDGDSPPSGAGGPEAVAQNVAKALGRELTDVDRLLVRQMHTAGKTVEEITRVLK